MELCKIKSLYSKKSNQQTKETCLQNEGEMFINYTSIRGLISRVHKELCTTNLQIIQSLMRSQTEQNVSRMKSF